MEWAPRCTGCGEWNSVEVNFHEEITFEELGLPNSVINDINNFDKVHHPEGLIAQETINHSFEQEWKALEREINKHIPKPHRPKSKRFFLEAKHN